jgi:hypothetical protein
VPNNIPQRGAISIKIELWEPNAKENVYLFNNHIKKDRLCGPRSLDTYEAFHEDDAISQCLRYRFHNPPGDFSTFERLDRRKLFSFKSRSLYERVFGPDDKAPIKRLSQIFNYAVPIDFSVIRIPFYFTTSREIEAIRFVLDDLLETNLNQQLSPIRVTIKKASDVGGR